jgi:hypothetical protein
VPWTAADAKKHKKGLSSSQAKKWARIANNVLRQCEDSGKSHKDCAASAVRIANSKVG